MITITGYKEIDRVLKGLPLQLSDKVLQSAGAKAAKPLVVKEQLLAPEGPTGTLIDSIGIVKGGFSNFSAGNRELGQVTVGPRRKGRSRAYHAHLVEFGTRRRKTRKGANRGVMPAHPFVRPAFDQTKDAILAGYKEAVGSVLISFMRRTLK